jgi:hypothetical protein
MKRFGLGLAAVALIITACGSTASSDPASSVVQPAASTAGSSAAPPAQSDAAAAGQTDTEWGRIWDTLPSDFPEIPGARPSEEAATGPASATLVVDGNVARLVASTLVDLLAKNGFPTADLGTPLEDGSYTLDATGSAPGCKVQATVKPMGGETFVTILYGAACPHD